MHATGINVRYRGEGKEKGRRREGGGREEVFIILARNIMRRGRKGKER